MTTALDLTWAQQRAREIVEYASQSENWYRPGPDAIIPGDKPEYVLQGTSVRAVFTWTVSPDDVRRHLSVSVKAEGRAPLPIMVWTLAHYFGFTGAKVDEHGLVQEPAPSWGFMVDEAEDCVVVQEPIHGGKF